MAGGRAHKGGPGMKPSTETPRNGTRLPVQRKGQPLVQVPAPAPVVTPPTFKVGDMAVHPAHGVGEVVAVEKRDLGGRETIFYVLKIIDTGLKVMVPTEAVARVGLRPVMKKKDAEKILDILRSPEVAVDLQPWNRRFRAYTEMLKSGLPTEIAKVLRDMYRLKFDKDLSFGERRLLDQARSLLVQELALAKRVNRDSIEGEIQQILSA
jgi:CarD family transcriptional regulator